MPILKSALKRTRSDKKRRARNHAILSDLKTRIKKFKSASDLKILVSKIDKAASKGVIHKNKASRLISRLTKKVRQSGAR